MSDPAPDPSPAPHRRWRLPLAVLAAVLLLAAGLRTHRLDEKSFWTDEFLSVVLATGHGLSYAELPTNELIPAPPDLTSLQGARSFRATWYDPRGHHPPLYQGLLRLWGAGFELGEVSVRAFSLVASVAAVAALFVVVAELSGTASGLWAAALMAVAGPQIQFGQEARPYALMLLEALGAAAALVRIERRGPSVGRAAALALCVLAMALTHYFTIGTLVALATYAAVRLRGPALRAAAAGFLVAALLWLPLGGPLAWRHVRNIDHRSTDFLRDDVAPGHAVRTARRAAALPVRYFTEPMANSAAPAVVGGAAFALAVLLPLRRRDLLLWGLWLPLTVAPLVVLDLARHTQHLTYMRYVLLGAPAVYALVAGSLSAGRGFVRHVPPLLAALSCAVALPAAYDAWWKADWRSLARAHATHARPGDVSVFLGAGDTDHSPSALFLNLSYYADPERSPIVLMTAPPDDRLLRTLRDAPGLLVVAAAGDGLSDALPGARFERLGFEPGAGLLWRATWPAPPATTGVAPRPPDGPPPR